jgi:DNA-binding protein HU-beta
MTTKKTPSKPLKKSAGGSTRSATKPATSSKAAATPKDKESTTKKNRTIAKPKSPLGAMTQAEFILALQTYCGIEKKKEAKDFFEDFAELIIELLKKGYKIPLPGIGKMQVRKTKARMGINPKTREPMKIAAKKKVKFTVAKALKDAVL